MTTTTIYGQEIAGLPDEELVLGVVVVVETLDPGGKQTVSVRCSEEVQDVDRLGMLTLALDRARAEAQEGWEDEEEE